MRPGSATWRRETYRNRLLGQRFARRGLLPHVADGVLSGHRCVACGCTRPLLASADYPLFGLSLFHSSSRNGDFPRSCFPFALWKKPENKRCTSRRERVMPT
jgi:hypothetical protein